MLLRRRLRMAWLALRGRVVVGESWSLADYPTADLADEIARRSDVCVLWCGRWDIRGDGADGICRYRVPRSLYLPLMHRIADRIEAGFSE